MNKYYLIAFLVLVLTGCSSFQQEKIVTKEVLVEKVPLELEMPKPVEWKDFEFIVVTPDNYEQVVDKLRISGKSVALFAVDEKSYANLTLVVNDMKRYIGEQKIIIVEYKKYYEK